MGLDRHAHRAMLSWLAALVAFSSFAACRRRPRPASSIALTETFSAPTGLFRVHYPGDFAATSPSRHSVIVVPTALSDRPDSSANTFIGNETPVSNDLNEYARVLMRGEAAQLHDVVETSRAAGPCLGNAGLVIDARYTGDDGASGRLHQCFFLHHGHGYAIGWLVRESRASLDVPLLQRIADATELTD